MQDRLPPVDNSGEGMLGNFLAIFGRRRVHEHFVQVIRSGKRYARVGGPHVFWVWPWEELGRPIYVGLRFAKLTFDNFSSAELVPVVLKVSVSYYFDPRTIGGENPTDRAAARELASSLVDLKDYLFNSVVEGVLLRLLRPAVAASTLSDLQTGANFPLIEAHIKDQLTRDAGLKRLGVRTSNFQIEACTLPNAMQERYIEAARTGSVQAQMQKASSAELAFAAVLKSLEKMNTGGGDYNTSTADLATSLDRLVEHTTPRIRYVETIDAPPTSAPPPRPPAPDTPPPPPASTGFPPPRAPDSQDPKPPDTESYA